MSESLYNMDLQYVTHTDNAYNVTAVRSTGYSQCRGSAEPCLWSTDGMNFNGVLSVTWPGAPYPPYAQIVTWKARQELEYFFSKYSAEKDKNVDEKKML